MLTTPKRGRGERGSRFIGRGAAACLGAVFPLFFTILGTSSSRAGEDLPAVSSLELEPFTLHLASRPFRWSWFFKEQLLCAQRYRRYNSALVIERNGKWEALGDLVALRPQSEGRFIAEVAMAEGEASLKIELEAGSAEGGPHARLWLEAPGATRLRDDIVPAPEEELFASSGSPCTVFSSKGYALVLSGGERSKLEAYAPDPDGFRLEAQGSKLDVEIWPGTPKEVLARRGLLLAKAASKVSGKPSPREVKDWTSLRAAVQGLLEDSVSPGGLRPVELAGAAKEGELALEARAVVEGAKETGAGGLRPLFVEFPGEREAWRARDEWLLGPGKLVAPILEPGATRRRLWLPPGEWRRVRGQASGETSLRGPMNVDAEVAPGEAAMYVRPEPGAETKKSGP